MTTSQAADWSDENALAIALYLDGSDDPDRAASHPGARVVAYRCRYLRSGEAPQVRGRAAKRRRPHRR
jgi:hypothetical protein